jgi:hypothetical protein
MYAAMNTLIHADIFFFVSTVCFAILAIFLLIALIYLIKILATLKRLSERATVEGNYLMDEVHGMADRMKRRAFNPLFVYLLIKRLIRRYL